MITNSVLSMTRCALCSHFILLTYISSVRNTITFGHMPRVVEKGTDQMTLSDDNCSVENMFLKVRLFHYLSFLYLINSNPEDIHITYLYWSSCSSSEQLLKLGGTA